MEQLGYAQTVALGGEPEPDQATLMSKRWRVKQAHFHPARWVEPFVHHQIAPVSWHVEPWSWQAVGQSHCGWGRKHNRENFAVVAELGWAGITSERSGQGREGQASTWVLEHLVHELSRQRKHVSPCALDWNAVCDCWGMSRVLASMSKTHDGLQKVLRHKQDWRGMGVTFAGVHLCGSQAHLLQVGDAQILRWRDGQLRAFSPAQSTRIQPEQTTKRSDLRGASDRQSLQHSRVGEGSPLETGAESLLRKVDLATDLIPSDNSCFETAFSTLSSNRTAIGWGGALLVEADSVSLKQGDIFVLASRGICDALSPSVFRDILGETHIPLEKRGQRLVDIATNTRFEHDDLTLVLVATEYQPDRISNETLKHWQGTLEDILFRDHH